MKTPKKLNLNQKFIEKLTKLLREGVKLGYGMMGQNTTNIDEKTIKLISPRFLSVLPEDNEQV